MKVNTENGLVRASDGCNEQGLQTDEIDQTAKVLPLGWSPKKFLPEKEEKNLALDLGLRTQGTRGAVLQRIAKSKKAKPASRANASFKKASLLDTEVVPALALPWTDWFKVEHTGEQYSIVLFQRQVFPVPHLVVLLFPLLLFAAMTAVWGICCFRSSRGGFSVRLICESALCFLCMWAELASKYNFTGAKTYRHYVYVVLLAGLISGLHVCRILLPVDKQGVVTVGFGISLLVVWAVITIEHVISRKAFKRTKDPMAGDAYITDCAVSLCCPAFTTMQEAQQLDKVQPPHVTEEQAKTGQAW